MNLNRRQFMTRVGRIALGTSPAFSLLGGGCSRKAVVPYTSVDQVVSEPVLREFERASGVSVRAVFDTEETKSTGVLNRLLAEAQRPQADLFWSGDPVRPFVLMEHGLVEPYASPNAAAIPDAFKAADGSWTGFAARARVLLVNRERLASAEPPSSVFDLASPRFRGTAGLANPLFGTTTMHVAAWSTVFGRTEMQKFLESIRANETRIASSNGEVKRLVVSGELTFGLTDTDDAHEAVSSGAAVDVVYPDQGELGTLIMPTTVVVIRNGPNPERARKLVDHLLSPATERQLAETAAHMPLQPTVQAVSEVRPVSSLRAMAVDYARIAAELAQIEPWLRSWSGV